MLALLIFGKFQDTNNDKMEEETITASDFGVFVTNIPLSYKEKPLKEWLEQEHQAEEILHVVY